MEKLLQARRNALVAATLAAAALSGCTIDSYLTDPSNVQCDGRRTKVNLAVSGMAIFIVHGKHAGDSATVKVRRSEAGADVAVAGDVTGPPQVLEADGFSRVTPVVDGPELSAFGAGGAWVIDVREDSVVIQGTCDGM
jgi:hypothetical protein